MTYIYIYKKKKSDVDKLVHVSGDLELDPPLPKKNVICFMESPLKKDKKMIFISSEKVFYSQDI